MPSSEIADGDPAPAVREARCAPHGRAVRPRDAATLIIADRRGTEARLLMGRRSADHGFMPGKWVFPGGRVEPNDFRVPCASELQPDVARALEGGLPPPRARALAVAAIRETFEETGLLLGAPSDQGCGRRSWQEFFSRGVAPDLRGLTYVARMITPPQRPKRFDTRFFLVDASRLFSRRPMDSRELEEVQWVSTLEAQDLDVALPTRMVLREISAHLFEAGRPILFRRFRTSNG